MAEREGNVLCKCKHDRTRFCAMKVPGQNTRNRVVVIRSARRPAIIAIRYAYTRRGARDSLGSRNTYRATAARSAGAVSFAVVGRAGGSAAALSHSRGVGRSARCKRVIPRWSATPFPTCTRFDPFFPHSFAPPGPSDRASS